MKTWKDIPGFFGFGKIYDEIAINCNNSSLIVEIGSYYGRSISYLLTRLHELNKTPTIVCIDHFKGSEEHDQKDYYEEFKKNIASLEIPISIKTMAISSDIACKTFMNQSVDYLMIDASHKYEDILNDITIWKPKVKPGGIISGDDYDWPGVKKAVHESLDSYSIELRRQHLDCTKDIYAGNYWFKQI